MSSKILIFLIGLISADNIYSKTRVISKKEVEDKIKNLAETDEITRMKKLIKDNSSAVVLIRTKSNSAKDDKLIYNSATKKREKKHYYKHGVTSGVILSKDGVVCSTYDSIMNSDEIIVSIDSEIENTQSENINNFKLTDKDYKAKIIKTIPELNLAFIKILTEKKIDFKFLPLGNDSKLINGKKDKILHNGALVIGKAKGEIFVTFSKPANSKNSFDIFSTAIENVSYKKMDGTPVLLLENQIIGDSVIPENNAGAIIDLDGKLLGIATLKSDDFSKNTSTGVPVSVIKQGLRIAVPSLISASLNTNLGISVEDAKNLKLTESDIKNIGLLENKDKLGVVVKSVELSSTANEFGIKVGDIILKFNDDIVYNEKLFNNLEKSSIGHNNIVLKILRNKEVIDLEINK